jgi:hypothetical protein
MGAKLEIENIYESYKDSKNMTQACAIAGNQAM